MARPDVQAPIHASWPVVEGWLAGFGPASEPLREATAWSPVFSAQSFTGGRAELEDLWTSDGDVSWLGGPAAAPLVRWPRNVHGQPLAHVLTFSLRDIAGAADDDSKRGFPVVGTGLPTFGVLEVFHDLTTYGWEPEDAQRRGWLVRWVPEPERALVDPPADVDTPTEACQAGLFLGGFSVPSSLDVGDDGAAGDAEFEVAETVTEQLQRAWLLQQTGSAKGHPVPVTHVYGHSQNGLRGIADTLATVLPYDDGDERVLVLDIESWTHLDQWFGDASPLEVWMRRSDLAARRFEAAWCVIRSD